MIQLIDIPTTPPKDFNKKKIKKETEKMAEKIGELAEILYAEKDRNLLIVLQGMDSSGKDGSSEKVFRDTSPMVVSAYGFKKPTPEEFAHDFLWRAHKQAPEKGKIQIFVRSHYEDILIQRVHKWIDEEHVEARMKAINAWENLLTFDNNTTVLKFYLHISKERQKEKLTERLTIAEKFWKHNDGDWDEREHWDEYMKAYEYAINESEIPWTIVPVDSRTYRNYIIAKKVLETLESFDLQFPPLVTEDL